MDNRIPADDKHPSAQTLLALQRATVDHLAPLLASDTDPLWLEALAAAADGHPMPPVATLDANLLASFGEQATALAALLDQPSATFAASRQTLGAKVATTQQTSTPWHNEIGFAWQSLLENGKLVIRLLRDTLATATPPTPPLIAVKGRTHGVDEAMIRQRITLSPEQTGDFELEALIVAEPAATHGKLVIRAIQPSRWPAMAGTTVQASAEAWRANGQTDEQGELELTGLPLAALAQLVFEVSPSGV